MSKSPRRPPQLVGKIFTARSVLQRGWLTPTELRSKAWRSLFRGVFADASMTILHEDRCLAASEYLLPGLSAVAGRSATTLYGVGGWRDDDAPVEVLIPPEARVRSAGLVVRLARLRRDEVTKRRGIYVTTPVRTCWDLAQWLDVVEAVVLVDALVRRHLVTVDELTAYANERWGQRGWRRALKVASLVDGAAESPQESRLRVRLVLARIPVPQSQYVITVNGRFVARTDLAWPEYRVAVEYDGRWHADSPDQIHHDRQRLNRLAEAGWVVLHVTSKRLRDDFDGFVAELRAVLRARRPSGVR